MAGAVVLLGQHHKSLWCCLGSVPSTGDQVVHTEQHLLAHVGSRLSRFLCTATSATQKHGLITMQQLSRYVHGRLPYVVSHSGSTSRGVTQLNSSTNMHTTYAQLQLSVRPLLGPFCSCVRDSQPMDLVYFFMQMMMAWA